MLYVVKGGAISRILPVSSGNGATYQQKNGGTARALTPVGWYKIQRRIVGERKADLGTLYDPQYFYRGWAIHGSNSVPAYPASHGCVRVTRADAKCLLGAIGNGMSVYLYGGKHTFPAGSSAPGTDSPTGDTAGDTASPPGRRRPSSAARLAEARAVEPPALRAVADPPAPHRPRSPPLLPGSGSTRSVMGITVAMRIGSLLLLVWLVIGAAAAFQRGYFEDGDGGCAKASTVAVTVVAGPLNYLGANPKTDCPDVNLDVDADLPPSRASRASAAARPGRGRASARRAAPARRSAAHLAARPARPARRTPARAATRPARSGRPTASDLWCSRSARGWSGAYGFGQPLQPLADAPSQPASPSRTSSAAAPDRSSSTAARSRCTWSVWCASSRRRRTARPRRAARRARRRRLADHRAGVRPCTASCPC